MEVLLIMIIGCCSLISHLSIEAETMQVLADDEDDGLFEEEM